MKIDKKTEKMIVESYSVRKNEFEKEQSSRTDKIYYRHKKIKGYMLMIEPIAENLIEVRHTDSQGRMKSVDMWSLLPECNEFSFMGRQLYEKLDIDDRVQLAEYRKQFAELSSELQFARKQLKQRKDKESELQETKKELRKLKRLLDGKSNKSSEILDCQTENEEKSNKSQELLDLQKENQRLKAELEELKYNNLDYLIDFLEDGEQSNKSKYLLDLEHDNQRLKVEMEQLKSNNSQYLLDYQEPKRKRGRQYKLSVEQMTEFQKAVAEKQPINEIMQKFKISRATYFNLKKKIKLKNKN